MGNKQSKKINSLEIKFLGDLVYAKNNIDKNGYYINSYKLSKYFDIISYSSNINNIYNVKDLYPGDKVIINYKNNSYTIKYIYKKHQFNPEVKIKKDNNQYNNIENIFTNLSLGEPFDISSYFHNIKN